MSIFTAIQNGDVDTIRNLLAKDPTLLNSKLDRLSPLCWAVTHNKKNVVRLLVEEFKASGYEINGITPLEIALNSKIESLILYLCKNGAQLNVDFYLRNKTIFQSKEQFKLFISHLNICEKSHPFVLNASGLLHLAVLSKNIDILSLLIEEYKVHPNKTVQGYTAFDYALDNQISPCILYFCKQDIVRKENLANRMTKIVGDPNLIHTLIKKLELELQKEDVLYVINYLCIPQYAAYYNNLKLIKKLIKKSFINENPAHHLSLKKGRPCLGSALHIAICKSHLECIQILLDAGTDITDIWQFAASDGEPEVLDCLYKHTIFQKLLQSGKDFINEEGRSIYKGYLPLHVAIRKEKSNNITKLISLGANVNCVVQDSEKDFYQMNAWFCAINYNKPAAIELFAKLYEHKDQDKLRAGLECRWNGFTLLLLAAYRNLPKMAATLITLRADINAIMTQGNNPAREGMNIWHLAVYKDHLPMIKMLGEHPAFANRKHWVNSPIQYISSSPFRGHTPLLIAAAKCGSEIIDELIAYGADVNSVVPKSRAYAGGNVFHMATLYKNIRAINALANNNYIKTQHLQKLINASLTAGEFQRYTPLLLAARIGFTEGIIKFLKLKVEHAYITYKLPKTNQSYLFSFVHLLLENNLTKVIKEISESGLDINLNSYYAKSQLVNTNSATTCSPIVFAKTLIEELEHSDTTKEQIEEQNLAIDCLLIGGAMKQILDNSFELPSGREAFIDRYLKLIHPHISRSLEILLTLQLFASVDISFEVNLLLLELILTDLGIKKPIYLYNKQQQLEEHSIKEALAAIPSPSISPIKEIVLLSTRRFRQQLSITEQELFYSTQDFKELQLKMEFYIKKASIQFRNTQIFKKPHREQIINNLAQLLHLYLKNKQLDWEKEIIEFIKILISAPQKEESNPHKNVIQPDEKKIFQRIAANTRDKSTTNLPFFKFNNPSKVKADIQDRIYDCLVARGKEFTLILQNNSNDYVEELLTKKLIGCDFKSSSVNEKIDEVAALLNDKENRINFKN